MNTQTESHTRLHGRCLLIARLAWVAGFAVLTVMYALGFLVARDALSTVCEEEPCTLRQQIRHTNAGEKIVSWPGPPIGYADPLRRNQVQALDALGLTLDQYGWISALQMGLPVLVYLLIAAGIFWRKSNDWMVLFASIMVATIPVGNGPLLFMLVARRPAWEWVFNSVNVVALSCFLIFPLIFPTGRFVPRWTRWMALFEMVGAIIITSFSNPIMASPRIKSLVVLYLLISFGAGAYAQLYRYFRMASPVERQQLKWVVVGLAGFIGIAFAMLLPLDALLTSRAAGMDPTRALRLSVIPDTIFQVILLFIPVSIAISVLRYRLWDIDIIISRTLVYSALTASIVGLYVLIVGGLSTLLQTQNNLPNIIIAILLIAFLLQPLRRRLQEIVDRFVPVPKVSMRESIPPPVPQTKEEQKVAVADSVPSTILRGHWLILARLAWVSMFAVLTMMYAMGFMAVHEALSTVCKEEPCALRQQIRHTEAGEQVMDWGGPPEGYADPLRADQVKMLETLGLTLDQYGWLGALQLGIPALVYLLIAAGLFWRKSDDWMVLFISTVVMTFPLVDMPLPYTLVVHQPIWQWVHIPASFVAVSSFFIFPLVFPTGRVVPRWTRWKMFSDIAFAIIGTLVRDSILRPPPGWDAFVFPYITLSFVTNAYAQSYRYFRVASPVERQQIKWVVVGVVGFIIIAFAVDRFLYYHPIIVDSARALLLSAIPDTIYRAITLFIPVSIAISVLRYRLWDIDIIISRTLVYGTLTASIVGLYILIVGGLGTLFQTQNNLANIVIAILLIAFLFQPLRRRLQEIVNHLVPLPKVIISESIPPPVPQMEKQQTVVVTDSLPSTILHGRWQIFVQLVWGIGFTVLIVMYALGFLAVHDALSTVCEDKLCSLRQQIRHSDAGDQLISSPGPTFGYADRLRPSQVEALERLGLTLDQYGWLGALQLGIPALILLLIGAGLFWWKPNDWMVLFASVMVATFPIHNTPLVFTLMVYRPAWERVYYLAGVVAISSLLIFPLIFPNGKFVPRWTRWMACYEVICAVIVMAVQNNIRQTPGGLIFLGAAFLFPSLGIGVYAQLYRYFRVARPAERQQFKWVVFGLVGFIVIQFFVLIPLNAFLTSRAASADPAQALILSAIPDTLWQINLLLMPICITASILRYRLWDIDLIISRTLVYGALSAGIVIMYILLVGLLGALFNTHVVLAASFLTAALTVPFFQPLRLRLQRAVNRVTFGGRDMPIPKQEFEESPPKLEMPLRQHWPTWLLFDITCVLSAISIIFLRLNWTTPVPETWGFRGDALLLALSFSCIGFLLARRNPQNSIGWLLIVAGLLCAIVEFCLEYATYALLTKPGTLPGGILAAWMSSWVWVIAIMMLIYTFLLFPTGQLPSARWRPVAWFVVAAFILMTITFMIQPGPLYFAPYLDNPFAVQPAYRALSPLQAASAGAILLIGLSVILRLRRAEGVERQQLKWFAYAAILITLIGITDSLVGTAGLTGRDPKFYQYLTVAIWIAIPFAIAFSILRYRLWDIDLIINRTLVYGALTAGIVTLYILLVGALSLLSQTMGNLVISLLATGLIAFLFQPLRERLQRGVNRLVYGERDDPYAALSRLGRRLEASLAPEAVLPTVVTTVREVLKLPYVAIYLKHDDSNKIAAESASPSLRSENGKIRVPGIEREGLCVPLIHQGETLGYIVLGPRAPNEAFSSTDLRLLDDLAPQVGVAVHAVRLTADLQRSRERLVLAREEERRRLRRDLHDDLGPTLASFGLTASTVADLIPKNPAAAAKLIKELEGQMRATVGNVRRLVYDLRPPTLDELGLLPAVRERATRFSNAPNGFHVMVTTPDELPALPAAVEVAAYRIVQEALENVSKHSQARQCTIRFVNHEGLEIEITDDGIGLPPNITPGVGLRSMRERAEELGGSCVIERGINGGTRVLACLPIGEFDGSFAHPDR